MKKKKLYLSKKLTLVSLLITSTCSFGAAFQLLEISGSGLGKGLAGEAAIAENATVVATNPAAMTLLPSSTISIGGVYIKPNINLNGKFSIYFPVPSNDGVIIASKEYDADHKKIVPSKLVPHLYGVYKINDNSFIGASANSNFGLITNFDPKYSAGLMGGGTELKTINYNLSYGHKIHDNISVGVGVNLVQASASLTRYVGAPADLQKIPRDTKYIELNGKKTGYGFNLGMLYELNENNRFGIAYHSPINLKFKDKLYTQSGIADKGVSPNSSTPASLNLKLPGYFEFSGYHKVLPKLALHYSYRLTDWRVFESLTATRDSDGKALFDKPEKFKKSHRYAVGLSYDVDNKLTLRTGYAYETTPIQEGYFSISIPDQNRHWLNLGATYKFTENLSADVSYSRIKTKAKYFTEVENKGSIVGKFKSNSKADLYGFTLNYTF